LGNLEFNLVSYGSRHDLQFQDRPRLHLPGRGDVFLGRSEWARLPARHFARG
jgi:hypothetical protein